jgi:hypothetical protein
MQNGLLARRPGIVVLLVGLVLPQLPFLAATLAGVGVPARPLPVVGYMLATILAPFAPIGLAMAAYLLVLAIDLAGTISLMFGLSILETVRALRFAAKIDLFASESYIVTAVTITAVTACALWLMWRYRAALRGARVSLPIIACLVVLVLDFWARYTPHYQFGLAFAGSAPFESAVLDTGFANEAAVREGRDLVLVIVESLGVFADPALRSRIEAPLDAPEVRARYEVSHGETTFFGSTTAAEMRELCGTRAPYDDVLEGAAIRCLPAILADAGYETVAFHGFTGAMFDRVTWYPEIGIQEMVFGHDILRRGDPLCGGVFVGMCDTDLARRIGPLLDRDRPVLLYWLTLNSHVPPDPAETSGLYDCLGPQNPFTYVNTCLMAERWTEVMSSVADIALGASGRPTEILVVGDHAPPLWRIREQDMFESGIVPWIHLLPKAAE